MAYHWIITKDHINEGEAVGISKTWRGPWSPACKDMAEEREEWLAANKEKTLARFQLFDDDNILYFEGEIWGEFYGFEPQDDYGTPSAGCTGTKIKDPGCNTFEWL